MNQGTLGDFAPEFIKELSQYHTPVKLARKIVRWSGLRAGMTVLEPSAGGGNIVREILRTGSTCEAVEIDPRWAELMRHEFPNVDIIEADFKKWTATDRYDIAIMNPPLNKGVGGAHVLHALRCAPRVISVLRGQDLHGKNRYMNLWKNCDLARLALLSERPVYLGEGGKIETIVVDVYRKGVYSGPQTIEHWPESWK